MQDIALQHRSTFDPITLEAEDPITLEVLRHGFRGICNEASALLARVAYAATITEGHDYSGSLLTAEGHLLAHGTKDQAAHLGTFESSLQAIMKAYPDPQPGDVYLFNDPYDGGSHQPDMKVVRPIFHGDGVLRRGPARSADRARAPR
jgi:N-methylhydantoinase B